MAVVGYFVFKLVSNIYVHTFRMIGQHFHNLYLKRVIRPVTLAFFNSV
jgi:hypothetical protein